VRETSGSPRHVDGCPRRAKARALRPFRDDIDVPDALWERRFVGQRPHASSGRGAKTAAAHGWQIQS